MSRFKKIARRTFLGGSVAVAGGVAFGVYLAKRAIPNPLLDELGPGEAALTPFVRIDAQGITLIAPRADMGQGIGSMQAYLIAEELDVDPTTVRVDPGKPHAAYYNGTVTSEGLPIPAYDERWLSEKLRGVMRTPAKLMGMQLTGGSTSVPDMYDRLRTAGAVARETLKRAAAAKTGISAAKLTTEGGAVVLPNGQRLTYVQLAPEAAKLDPVTDVTLRDPEQWRYLGKQVQRLDIVPKTAGTLKYGIDLQLKDMLFATVRTNPGLGGTMKSFDASRAQKMRGVKKIVELPNGVGVIADNTWRAFRAAQAIEFEWGPAPYPATSAEMWKTLEASGTSEHQDNRFRDDGDVEQGLGRGKVIEAEYRLPYLAHAPMEPMNAVVKVTADRVDIWTGTQIPAIVRDHAAALTGCPPEAVHVHAQPIGGSFGRRLEDTYAMQAVQVAMAMKGTPVKMTWSREEDMSHDYPRPMHLGRGRGTVADGKVDTFDLDSISQSMTASWMGRLMGAPPGPDLAISLGAWDQPFAIPNYRVTGYRAPEMVPVSSWRAPGACSNGFIHDSFLDELIHAAGADPMQERLRLCHHEVSRKVLQAAAEMSGWDGAKLGPNRGRGVAFILSHGVPTAEVIEVTVTPAGVRIDKVFIALDVGRILDPINFEAQVFGGVIWALGHAMNSELTYEDYAPQQTNYHQFEGMRLYQTPQIVVRGLQNGHKIRGVGEPSVPPAAPALANAIFAATGKRIRELPLGRHIDFV